MNDLHTIYSRPVSAFNHQQWPEVIALAAPLVKQAPEHPGLHFILRVAAIEQRQLAQAFPCCGARPRSIPNVPITRPIWRGRCPQRQARQAAIRAAEMKPANAVH